MLSVMVLKHERAIYDLIHLFQYHAICDGSQTFNKNIKTSIMFQYHAICDGSQTEEKNIYHPEKFQYHAICDGSQTSLADTI